MERLAIEAKKTGERFLADQFPSDDEYEKELCVINGLYMTMGICTLR